MYYDTTENEFKGYKASSWDSLGGEDTWITTQTCSADYALQSVGKTTKTCINKVDYSDVAYDVSCTNCLTSTEVASADLSYNLSCTGCVAETEIAQNTLDDSEIQDNSLTAGSLAANACGNSELIDSPTFVDLNSIRAIYGDYGTIVKSTDEWLRLNDGSSHTSGVYIPNKLRADGGLYVGDDEYFYRGAEDRIDTTDNVYLSATTYLGTTSTYFNTSGSLAMGNQKITGLATPTAAADAATKGYVDASSGGSCYEVYGSNTCYSGYTRVVAGYTTIYAGGYVDYTSMLACSPVSHKDANNSNASIRGISYNGYFKNLGDEPCAICCK